MNGQEAKKGNRELCSLTRSKALPLMFPPLPNRGTEGTRSLAHTFWETMRCLVGNRNLVRGHSRLDSLENQ